jgi:phosphoglycerate dehydrogenase-like enzyme
VLSAESLIFLMPKPSSLFAALTPTETRDFLPEPLLAEVRSLAPAFHLFDPTDRSTQEFNQVLAKANPEIILAAWKTPALPAQLPPATRYVCYLCGSVKKLVTSQHLQSGLIVTNWGGSISRIVAEWALFHILCGLRHASYWSLAMHTQGAWKGSDTATASLFGRRVGLHGFGMVARELVRLLSPFGCAISVHAPDVDEAVAKRWGMRCEPSLEGLFSGNDIIVELAPLIPETTGIISEALLRRIQPGGVFVNLGRGAVVDEAGLIAVAKEGKISFGLDVYALEPLPRTHPLRGLPNVMLTPHIGGPTNDRRQDAGAFALKNLRAYASDQPMEAVVTPEVFAVTS